MSILEGSLRHFPAAELLAMLGANRHSGTLTATVAGGRVTLILREGRLDAASGPNATEPVDIVAALLNQREGTFLFDEPFALPGGITPLDLDLAPLIQEAERAQADADRQAILFADGTVLRVVDRPRGADAINLTGPEFQLLVQLAGGRSVADLKRSWTEDISHLYATLERLHAGGLIEVIAGERTTAPLPPDSGAPAVHAAVSALMAEPPRARPAASRTSDIPLAATLTTAGGQMHPILEQTTTIGRGSSNSIQLGEASVSARHAKIVRAAEGFFLEDVGSRNGSYINGERIATRQPLTDRDVVRFGTVVLTFKIVVEANSGESTVKALR